MEKTLMPLARPLEGDRSGTRHHAILAASADQRTVAAAIAALLHRYTGETDVLIGLATGTAGLTVTDRTTMADLVAAAADAPILPAEDRPYHAAVGAAPDERAAFTVVIGDGTLDLVMSVAEFDADAADQYARHLDRIFAAAAADPSIRVRDIELVTGYEAHRTLVDWNQTEREIPREFFHEIVAEVARRTPDATAIVWPDGRLTYRELDDAANRLANHLDARGVGRHDRVGTCFKRGPESLIAQLACFKLGAAAILLDPDFPAERIRFMVEDASAVTVLTMKEHAPAVAGPCPVITLDGSGWADAPATLVSVKVDADDLIHICYTSGSTGLPKAVMVRHGAARNLIYSMRVLSGMTDRSRGTWLAAPGYGMVEVECFPLLAAGAEVHIPEPSVVTSPEWLRDWLVAEEITHTLLMKAMCERLWVLDWPAGTALRNVRIAGERVQAWPSADLPFHVFNLYGSAEATVVATCDITELGQRLGEAGRTRLQPPIGRPTPNVKAYVLDDELRPVPPGVVGEIHVAGHSLSAGYLGRPDATAEKWIADPYGDGDLYKTGDLARYWTDGSIEIVGRTDNQVKVRGNRVHLGEIEAVLAGLPGVGQGVVAARRDEEGDVKLVAYVEPAAGPAPEGRELRGALQQRLPSFMVPSAFVVGDLPRTTNGKIDRKNLPEPPRSRPDIDSPYQEPRNDIERSLQRIWSELLDLDDIGVLDNFFELGGDSLGAARLTEKVSELYTIELDLDELLDAPSIEGQAALVAQARQAELTGSRAAS
ncbi:amino acid adenylation domain-containing protein [Spirillospora sp. NPDC048911]|uniref:non-ribosomal peptide synthetase n=1 Tax=Spirillospora sp. NPDC048911 TaxID=3364527 RepID=UPI00371EE625